MALNREDTSTRSLAGLYSSASTSRVFNALKVFQTHQQIDDTTFRPIFANKHLNKSLIVKHTLRMDERYMFQYLGCIVTKILFPIDVENLNAGARYVYIGQHGWMDILAADLGMDRQECSRDFAVLELLDKVPSFDPFLLREWLARAGITPPDAYFMLSNIDVSKMESFVFSEVSRLVANAFAGATTHETIIKLVRKLLNSSYDEELEPLRLVLGLSRMEFRDGLFAWKGFLYYKWMAKNIQPLIPRLITELGRVMPPRRNDPETFDAMEDMRRKLGRDMVAMFNSAAASVNLYENSFKDLSEGHSAKGFREFLLSAPDQFIALGKKMGILSHLLHSWQFRTSGKRVVSIKPDELWVMLQEYSECVAPMEMRRQDPVFEFS